MISDDLDTLTRRGWDQKLSSLTFKAEPFLEGSKKVLPIMRMMDLDSTEAKFPRLELSHCSGCICLGPLHAPNLTAIILQPSGLDRPVDWRVFEGCCRLELTHVTIDDLFDCRGCSFPSSLRHIWWRVGHLQEHGCFSCVPSGLQTLETLHISFNFQPPSNIQPSFLDWESRERDFDLDDNIFAIYMPPRHNAVWAAKHPGWLGRSYSVTP